VLAAGRRTLDRLRTESELEHALASDHLFTDGAEVPYNYARAHGDKQLRLLTVVRSGQRVFHEVIERYLTRITYEGGWAARLVLPITAEPLIIADPERAFGQPIFIHGGARLADVRGRVRAGEDQESVAQDYGVPLEDVRAAHASHPLSRRLSSSLTAASAVSSWPRSPQALVAYRKHPEGAAGERFLLLWISGDSLVLGERDPASPIHVQDPIDVLHLFVATGGGGASQRRHPLALGRRDRGGGSRRLAAVGDHVHHQDRQGGASDEACDQGEELSS